jgi:tripartite-type tricarboxylate transporter receptor subunit TctC
VTSFAPNNLRELVAYAKANPDKVTYATAGTGGSNHLAALVLERYAGIKMTQVAYRGGGPMIQALLGQQVSISILSTPLILPHIKSGKVKALAVGGRERIAQLPEVPTLAETYPGFEQFSWFGILGPKGMPREAVERVHRDIVRTLQTPEVRQRLTEQGFDLVGSSPEGFLRFVQAESEKLGKIIRDNGIKVE